MSGGCLITRALLRVGRLFKALFLSIFHRCCTRGGKATKFTADVVLVLGGSLPREEMALECYRDGRLGGELLTIKPHAPCIVSSGAIDISQVQAIGLRDSSQSVILDHKAVCTVTNFTSLVDELSSEFGAQAVAVVTSDYHLPRAYGVGLMVLAAHGMSLYGVGLHHELGPNESGKHSETLLRRLRDYARVWCYLLLDMDFSNVVNLFHPSRRPDHVQQRLVGPTTTTTTSSSR